jgi:hypothetical protein
VAGLDAEVRRALGVVQGVDDLTPAAAGVVLARLAEPDRAVGLRGLLALWAWLADLHDDEAIDLLERVRAWTPDGPTVVDVKQAVVIDQPMWLQRNDFEALVIAPAGRAADLADLLDLDLATERVAGAVTSAGVDETVPPVVAEVLAGAPTSWRRHARLEVDGVPVDWWVDDSGQAHAVDAPGLARALAWAAGSWSTRFVVAAVLADGASTAALVADAAFD